MEFPKELRYSEEHEWVRVEGNKAYIGITSFAQSELGDIVFVELPEVGSTIQRDEPFGSVESVKTVSELYAPVTGKVLEINGALEEEPELVNTSSYDKAWMIVVELSDSSELDKLMDADKYEAMVKE
ncbi:MULTISPECIES: glycine cleavage system protein GcvH [Brevibacillus]|uniref:glycine cleavage system protein GcvH n=1 Tax=Brevibacillus TaxID=55080 RepID=UPI000BD5284A|nr:MULTISPECIES: glycine cleavage system protein GcvH [Brevibacillus]MBA4532573.1 glycine cleavage system protein GcvH [Brevibacillus halotolerans]PCN44244.1 glycine cleavage system protein H [Brevibacillus laterosporus]